MVLGAGKEVPTGELRRLAADLSIGPQGGQVRVTTVVG